MSKRNAHERRRADRAKHPKWSEAYEKFFAEHEIRVTNEKTGGEKGRKPQAFDLVPWDAVAEIAEVYHYGKQKYEARNWERGYEWSASFAALMRHLTAFWQGEDNDPETGLSHMAHAGFHVLALLRFQRKHPELNDRPGSFSKPTP